MTPALAQVLVFCWAVTWAATVPSPVRVCAAKWKESAVPQMSPPPPTSVQVPPGDRLSEPAGRAPPMSAQLHPDGQRPGGGVSPGVMATESRVTAEPVPWAWDVIPNPASRVPVMARAWVDPGTRVQVVPSGDE